MNKPYWLETDSWWFLFGLIGHKRFKVIDGMNIKFVFRYYVIFIPIYSRRESK